MRKSFAEIKASLETHYQVQPFADWCREKGDAPVGESKRSDHCPVANYLINCCFPENDVSVGSTTTRVWWGNGQWGYVLWDTPPWAVRLIDNVDQKPYHIYAGNDIIKLLKKQGDLA